MPLIHAIEFSNYMNYRRKSPWSPDWRHARFLLKGLHTAINIPNGRGKSTLIQTILSMLVWDTKSLKALQKTHWAPTSSPAFTHIRIEITNRNLVQSGLFSAFSDPTDGDHMVFGIYGNASENDKPDFYAYHGTLDDCPIAIVELHRTTLISKEAFLENLGRLKASHGLFPAHPRDRQGGEWKRFVSDYFDMSSLQQQHKYQLANGAEGSAKYFDVAQPGGNYSAELFYKHLAPELLSEVMGGYGEDDERGIEDTIHEKASGVVRARRETHEKTLELHDSERVLTVLGRLCKMNAAIDAKHANVVAASEVVATELAALQDALNTRAVPGVPLPPGPDLPAFYQEFVLQDGQWWISDKGLGIFSGEGPSPVNQRAGRPPMVRSVEVKKTQVIDFKCDLSSGNTASARPGWKPKLFNLEAALVLLGKTTSFGHSWSKEMALDAIDKGFAWVASKGDTNPARLQLVSLERQLGKNKELRLQAQVLNGASKIELENNERERKQLQSTSVSWQQIVNANLFSSEEIGDLINTALRVRDDVVAANAAYTRHQAMAIERTPIHQAWTAFVQSHGNVSPARLADTLVAKSEADNELVKRLGEAVRLAREDVTRAAAIFAAADQAWHSADQRVAKATDLEKLAHGYGAFFGSARPEDLEGTVLNDLKVAKENLDRNKGAFHRLDAAVRAINTFKEAVPSMSPDDWLGDRSRRMAASTELLEKSRSELVAVADSYSRADSLRADAHQYTGFFGSETPKGLEARVRDALGLQERNLREVGEQLIRLEEGITAIATFTDRVEGVEPGVWLVQRKKEDDDAQRVLLRDRAALGELSTRRAALDQSPVAPGPVAREVARIAGKNAVFLHDFVDSLALDSARKNNILTLFSALLFAPVFKNTKGARAAASVLAEEGIEAPVFLGPALESFCRTGNVNADGDSVSALFIGVRTRQVACLIDPTLIEREKAVLDKQILELESSCAKMNSLLAQLGLSADLVPVAQSAARALADGTPARFAALQLKAKQLQVGLPPLVQRASDSAVASIRASLLLRTELKLHADAEADVVDSAFASLAARRGELKDCIEECAAKLAELEQGNALEPTAVAAALAETQGVPAEASRLQRDIATSESELPDLLKRASPDAIEAIRAKIRLDVVLAGESFESLMTQRADRLAQQVSARADTTRTTGVLDALEVQKGAAEFERRVSEEAALESKQLYRLQDYADDPEFGPLFMVDNEARAQTLQSGLQLARDRTAFDFDSAQAFISSGGADRLAKLQAGQSELQSKIETSEKVIAETGSAIEDVHGMLPPLQRAASQIDGAILALRSRWNQIVPVLDTSAPIPRGRLADHPLTVAAQSWRGSTSTEDVAADMSNVCDALATSDDAGMIERLKAAQGALKYAREVLSDEIDRTLGDVTLKLPETARVKLAQSKMTPAYLTEMLSTSQASFAKNGEANRIANEHLTKERGNLSEWLSKFTLRLPNNLKTLRAVFAPRAAAPGVQARAGFDIEATVIDNNGVGTLIEKIIRTVEDLENGELAAAKTPEKLRATIQRTLRETIRDTFYREVILKPRIRLVLPSISSRSLEMEKNMASSGQGVAITFLWILKLAAFINEREIQRQTVDGAQRRRVRDKASAFTILDGAFSHLSDKNLINETLAGIEDSLGRFQLIITGHDPAYENDFKRFPALVAAREMSGHYMRASSHHHTMENEDEHGLLETFHAIQIPKLASTDGVPPP